MSHPVPRIGAERVETVIGVASAVLVAAMVAHLLWQGVAGGRRPPALFAALSQVRDGSDRLQFVLRNDGGRPATAVVLRLELRDGDAVVAERHLTVDYLPGGSSVTGAFLRPPASEALAPEVVVEGYLDP